jgi:hypothetical protein
MPSSEGGTQNLHIYRMGWEEGDEELVLSGGKEGLVMAKEQF